MVFNHVNTYGTIEWVSEFPYLGFLIADNGMMDVEVEKGRE